MVKTITIPPCTDPLGRYWRMPRLNELEIHSNVVLMTHSTFDDLMDYSNSRPTGVYPGKMWKGRCWNGRTLETGPMPGRRFTRQKTEWYLIWYGEDIDGQCSVNYLPIKIVGRIYHPQKIEPWVLDAHTLGIWASTNKTGFWHLTYAYKTGQHGKVHSKANA